MLSGAGEREGGGGGGGSATALTIPHTVTPLQVLYLIWLVSILPTMTTPTYPSILTFRHSNALNMVMESHGMFRDIYPVH